MEKYDKMRSSVLTISESRQTGFKLPPINEFFEILEEAAYYDVDKDISFASKAVMASTLLDILSAIATETAVKPAHIIRYRKEFFERRNELSKSNVYRWIFIELYLDEEVLKCYSALKLCPDNYPKNAKRWDKYFNELCNEYDEIEHLRSYPPSFYEEPIGKLCFRSRPTLREEQLKLNRAFADNDEYFLHEVKLLEEFRNTYGYNPEIVYL